MDRFPSGDVEFSCSRHYVSRKSAIALYPIHVDTSFGLPNKTLRVLGYSQGMWSEEETELTQGRYVCMEQSD